MQDALGKGKGEGYLDEGGFAGDDWGLFDAYNEAGYGDLLPLQTQRNNDFQYDADYDGFGPGQYLDEYDGQGDRLYWGNRDGADTDSSAAGTTRALNFGPGGIIQQVVSGSDTGTGTGTGIDGPVVPDPIPFGDSASSGYSGDGSSMITDNPSEGGYFSRAAGNEGIAAGVEADVGQQLGGGSGAGTGPDTSFGSRTTQVGGGSVEMQQIGDGGASGTSGSSGGGTQSTGSAMQSELDFLREGNEGGSQSFNAGIDELTSGYSGDSYHGSYSVIDTGEDTFLGDLPDLPAAGELEMQIFNTPGAISDTGPSFVDSGGPDVIPGRTLPGPYLGSDAAPLMLGDIPEDVGSAFSWEMIDPELIPADLLPAFTESLSDMSNLSLGSEGIGSSMGGFLGFAKNRAVDLIGGQLMMPMFSWLDDATGNPWVSRSIQGTLAMYGLLAGGDPFGVIAAPIGWGIQEYIKQRHRLIANADPEAERGKKFGYVRDGDKWYPAIQTSKERDEGWIGSNKTQIKFQYGTEIKWKKMKGSTEWIPYFEEGTYKMKDFHVWDSEADDPTNEAGEIYQKRADPLRDFYYLTEEETLDFLHGVMGGTTAGSFEKGHTFTPEEQAAIQAAQSSAYENFAVKDDQNWSSWWSENYNDEPEYLHRGPYINELQDIRKSFDFMQSYRYSDPGSLENTDFGVDEFEGSRGFREAVNNQGKLGTALWDSWTRNPPGPVVYTDNDYEEFGRPRAEYGWSPADIADQGAENFGNLEELKYLSDEYWKNYEMLYKTQEAAGDSMHFDTLFPLFDTYLTGEKGGGGSMLYMDNSWKFGRLGTADELHDALAKIEASGESEYMGTEHYRNEDQRSYLAQKAYTRYLHTKITQLGGWDYIHTVKRQHYGYNDFYSGTDQYQEDPDRYVPHAHSMNGFDEFDPMYSKLDDDGAPLWSYGQGIVHRDDFEPGTWDYMEPYTEKARQELIDHGVGIGLNDPDYIAGRYTDYGAYEQQMHPEWVPWDPIQEEYVSWEDVTPGLVYNPDTHGYEIPPTPETDEERYNRIHHEFGHDDTSLDPDFEPDDTPDDKPDEGPTDTVGVTDVFKTEYGWGEDAGFEEGIGGALEAVPGFDYPITFQYGVINNKGVLTAPDGTIFSYPDDRDAAWDYAEYLDQLKTADEKKKDDEEAAEEARKQAEEAEEEAQRQADEDAQRQADEDAQRQAEEDAIAAEEAAEAARKQAEEDAIAAQEAAEPKPQVVPDEHPGATHIHDTPWVPPDVPYLPHYLPDPHIPQQLPLDQIAAEIAEGHTGSGVKVI